MKKREEISSELMKIFEDGSVFNASNEDLNIYLKHLCSGHVENEEVRHREINRCQVISTIKSFRFIDSIEEVNKRFTKVIIFLAVVTIFLSFYTIWNSINTKNQIEQLISNQNEYNSTQIESMEILLVNQKESFDKIINIQKHQLDSINKNK